MKDQRGRSTDEQQPNGIQKVVETFNDNVEPRSPDPE